MSVIQAINEAKGKIANATLKDVDSQGISDQETRFLSTEDQQRMVTLPDGSPCLTYTNDKLSMVLSGDTNWTANSDPTAGCMIMLDPDSNGEINFLKWYDDPSEATRDFKAITVDLDNGVALGDVISTYDLTQGTGVVDEY